MAMDLLTSASPDGDINEWPQAGTWVQLGMVIYGWSDRRDPSADRDWWKQSCGRILMRRNEIGPNEVRPDEVDSTELQSAIDGSHPPFLDDPDVSQSSPLMLQPRVNASRGASPPDSGRA